MQRKPQSRTYKALIPNWHALQLFMQLLPVVGLQFGIFHEFLSPVLVPAADVVLRLLEVNELVSYALFNEDVSSVLSHD